MTDSVQGNSDDFSLKLWLGESMCLAGMNVDDPEDDLVGFSIEARRPGDASFKVLHNKLRFGQPAGVPVTDGRDFPSTEAPFQKFRRIHSPWGPEDHDRLRG